MEIFGRKTARQRLRRAAQQSLTVPAFSAPPDCTAWVLGGLWPAELTTAATETATLAEYLDADLQRIASSANEKLQALSRSGLAGSARRAAETRVINVARAFAVLRVESTVRQLRHEALDFGTEYLSLNPAPPPPRRSEVIVVEQPDRGNPPVAPRQPTPAAGPEVIVPDRTRSGFPSGPVVVEAVENPPVAPEAKPAPEAVSAPEAKPAPEAEPGATGEEREAGERRLRGLLEFAARQEPGLRWAVGVDGDGGTLLVTDLAHGWIPPGIDLPAGVRLLAPGWRDGAVAALLGPTALSATYAPGDRMGWAAESGPPEPSPRPRELPMVDDLGWLLTEATHWRDGLPRMVHTLAKAGAAGTGVIDAEVDLLRVHLDTAWYQLLAQYPEIDLALLLNCLLLAATVGIATGEVVSANYHFAWFQTLSAPPARE